MHPRLDLKVLEVFPNLKDSVIERFTGSAWCLLAQVFMCGQHSKRVKLPHPVKGVNERPSELPSRNLRGEIHVLKVSFLQAVHRWNLFQVLEHFVNYAQNTSKIFTNVIFTSWNASPVFAKMNVWQLWEDKGCLNSQQGRRKSVIAHLQKSLSELKCGTTNVVLFMNRNLTYLAVYSGYNIWDSPA